MNGIGYDVQIYECYPTDVGATSYLLMYERQRTTVRAVQSNEHDVGCALSTTVPSAATSDE